MYPLRQVTALTLSLLIAAPPSCWSCAWFGVRVNEAIQTGLIEGNTRTEILVAKYDDTAPFIVKFFVGPPNADVKFKQVSPEEMTAKFDGIAAKANRILNPRGLRMRSARQPEEPPVVAEIKIGNMNAKVLNVSGDSWETLSTRYKIDTDEDIHYSEWVRRVVAESGRGLYALYIDVSQVQDKTELDKLLALAVTIPYAGTGNKLREEVTLDKWLEYKGARYIATGFGTDWTKQQAIQASTLVMNDWDLADHKERLETVKPDAGSQTYMMMKGQSYPDMTTFTLDGDQNTLIVYRNTGYVLAPHSTPRPAQALPPPSRSAPGKTPSVEAMIRALTPGNK